MQRIPLVSSGLKSAGYDAETQTLELELAKGEVYQYFKVPLHIYVGLLEAESKGKFYLSEIRNFFEYLKLE